MQSFTQILDALGGLTVVATAIRHPETGKSLPLTTVASWSARSSIPPLYWPPLVDLARQRGVKGITITLFAELAAKPIQAKGTPRARTRAA